MLPVAFAETGTNRLVVIDADVSTQGQTLGFKIISQNGNALVNKFSISAILAPDISANAYIGTLSVAGMLDFETTPVYKLNF